MNIDDLAKLMAGREASPYQSDYFSRVDATYECYLENFTLGQNRRLEDKIVFEFAVAGNCGATGANPKGSSTKIIYSVQEYDIDKAKRHLAGILHVPLSDLQAETGEKLIREALEPREETDGKSILSGTPVTVTVTMQNTAQREAEGKPSFQRYSMVAGHAAEEAPF